jgi:hypothetical protein
VALTAMKINFDEFNSGGLHEKHAEATWYLGSISAYAKNGLHLFSYTMSICHDTGSTESTASNISLIAVYVFVCMNIYVRLDVYVL